MERLWDGPTMFEEGYAKHPNEGNPLAHLEKAPADGEDSAPTAALILPPPEHFGVILPALPGLAALIY